MFTRKKIIIIVLVVLTLGIAWIFYRKYREAKKLKIGNVTLAPSPKISDANDIINILKKGLLLEGEVEIRNFSGKKYTLNQLSLDCFLPGTEKIIAEQTNIIQKNIELKDNNVTPIPLNYKVDLLNSLKLFKACGVIPEDATIWKIISNPEEYYQKIDLKKLRIKLAGFIQIEGITLPINLEYPLYE